MTKTTRGRITAEAQKAAESFAAEFQGRFDPSKSDWEAEWLAASDDPEVRSWREDEETIAFFGAELSRLTR